MKRGACKIELLVAKVVSEAVKQALPAEKIVR